MMEGMIKMESKILDMNLRRGEAGRCVSGICERRKEVRVRDEGKVMAWVKGVEVMVEVELRR